MTGEARDKGSRDAPPRKDQLSRGRQRLDVPDSPLMERAQRWILDHNVECLHGPEEVDYGRDELVALTLVRNGRSYVKSFVEHYSALGVKHLVFLDNGSTDGTIEALKEYDNVTVLRTGVPYKTYNVAMKRYLIERFGRGRWTLSLDVDELFDYPYSDVVGLGALLGYLNEHRYTAAVAHMLDVFPESPLSEVAEGRSLKERHRLYDLADVIVRDYSEAEDLDNVLPNGEIKIYQGGVQKRLFGISPLLTKHSLVFLDGRLRPMDLSDHFAGGARVADFTGLLLHYKLSPGIFGMVRREIEERSYPNRYGKYDKYTKVLKQAPSLLVKSETSRELRSANDLVHNGFLAVSEEYMSFVDREERKSTDEPRALLKALCGTRKELGAEDPRTAELRDRVRELERDLDRERQRAGGQESRNRSLESRNRNLEKHAANLERQMRAVYSSRAWRLLIFLGRVKAAVVAGVAVRKRR